MNDVIAKMLLEKIKKQMEDFHDLHKSEVKPTEEQRMIKFSVEEQDSIRPLIGSITVDGEGDLLFMINGHCIAFIDCKTGKLNICKIPTDYQGEFPGLSIKNDQIDVVSKGNA